MKIKIKKKSFTDVMAMERPKHKRPMKPARLFRWLMKTVSIPDLKKTHFKAELVGMERLGKGEPALYLMNHSSFIDLEIAAKLIYPRPFNIVTTTDAFIGKELLMRLIGCIPTKKFQHDPSLVRDIIHVIKNLRSSVVLYPEASYTFDGTATPIPKTVGTLIKMLGVPVIMIRTYGAFSRDPLYNNLQVRRVDVSAREEYLLSPDEIAAMSDTEIFERIEREFSFDNFRWQEENRVVIDEPFRADYLNRVLYKCPACLREGEMLGRGTEIRCTACGKVHTLTELGRLDSPDGKPAFTHVPDWYAWERECVRREIEEGTYSLDTDVDILMAIDTKHLYRVGEGRLVHSNEGFHLTGCDGQLDYVHKPLSSYSIYSDFNWYEVGDVISIGNHEAIYYCFPRMAKDVVAKARLAAEELYKMIRRKKRETNE